MSKVFMVVFLIFGTVVGSGFSSGKEIMVFFSRFGAMSYFYILLAGILFFLLFYFFLTHGEKIAGVIENSRILNYIILFISIVFCSSMFAGIKNLFSYFPIWLFIVLFTLVLACCLFVTLKGLKGLEKINFILMPTTSVLFLIVLLYGMSVSSDFSVSTTSIAGMLYSPLYVALNTSMSGLVFSKVGKELNKKQTLMSCLFSTILILMFLFLGNFVLQRNGESYYSEMPFLYLTGDNTLMFVICFIVILSGCFTTLISLCYTLKTSFDKVVLNDKLSTAFAVFLPLLVSTFGFSKIVSYLYPICSVLGIFILFCMLFSVAKKQKLS